VDLSRHNRRLISLTIPLTIEQLLRITMGNINIFLLGLYNDSAVAAVGVANQFINLGQMLLTISATGGAVIISQYIGGKNDRRANEASLMSIVLSLSMGALICPILLIFSNPLLKMVNLDSALLPDASSYLRIVGGTLFLHGVFSALSAVCRCYGKARLPMYGILLMNILNLTGTLLAVRGFLPWSNVVTSIACINAISTFFGLLLLFVLALRSLSISFSPRVLRPFPVSLLKEVVGIGLPSGMDSVSYNIAQLLTTAMIAGFGVVTLSAKAYMSSIAMYVYVVGMCFGQAAQLVVASVAASGKLDEATALVKRNFWINLGMNAGISLLILIFRRQVAGLFTQNEAIIDLMVVGLIIDFFTQSARAMNHSFNLALRSVGDVRFTMTLMIFATWMITVPISYLFGVHLGWGLLGIWGASAIDEAFRGGSVTVRWCLGRWKPRMQARIDAISRSRDAG